MNTVITPTEPLPSSSTLCKQCCQEPKHYDARKYRGCCGRLCYVKSIFNVKIKIFVGRKKSVEPPLITSAAPPIVKTDKMCAVADCYKPVRKEGELFTRYCSQEHERAALSFCLACNDVNATTPFCSIGCLDATVQKEPRLMEVPITHVIYQDIVNQFTKSWRNGSAPTVKHIYKIVLPQGLYNPYLKYRANVEKSRKCVKAGKEPGNETKGWHGTYRSCKLGDDGKTQLCSTSSCCLCNIISKSYDVSKAKYGTYGKGIYTALASSTSNNFSRNVPGSPTRAMILNKVILGKESVQAGRTGGNLKEPASGTDSVRSGRTGFDQLVVYKNDAIRPSYLLIYATP